MAERQTHQLEGLAGVILCEFKSRLAHQNFKYTSALCDKILVKRSIDLFIFIGQKSQRNTFLWSFYPINICASRGFCAPHLIRGWFSCLAHQNFNYTSALCDKIKVKTSIDLYILKRQKYLITIITFNPYKESVCNLN